MEGVPVTLRDYAQKVISYGFPEFLNAKIIRETEEALAAVLATNTTLYSGGQSSELAHLLRQKSISNEQERKAQSLAQLQHHRQLEAAANAEQKRFEEMQIVERHRQDEEDLWQQQQQQQAMEAEIQQQSEEEQLFAQQHQEYARQQIQQQMQEQQQQQPVHGRRTPLGRRTPSNISVSPRNMKPSGTSQSYVRSPLALFAEKQQHEIQARKQAQLDNQEREQQELRARKEAVHELEVQQQQMQERARQQLQQQQLEGGSKTAIYNSIINSRTNRPSSGTHSGVGGRVGASIGGETRISKEQALTSALNAGHKHRSETTSMAQQNDLSTHNVYNTHYGVYNHSTRVKDQGAGARTISAAFNSFVEVPEYKSNPVNISGQYRSTSPSSSTTTPPSNTELAKFGRFARKSHKSGSKEVTDKPTNIKARLDSGDLISAKFTREDFAARMRNESNIHHLGLE